MSDLTLTVGGHDYTIPASACPCCGCCACGCAFCLKIKLRLINGCGSSGPYVIDDTHGAPVVRWLNCSGTREWTGVNPSSGLPDTYLRKVSGVWDLLSLPFGHWTSTSTADCPPPLTSFTYDASGDGTSGDPCDPSDDGADGLNQPSIISGDKDRFNDNCCRGGPDWNQIATDFPTLHILCTYVEPGGCSTDPVVPQDGFDADFDSDVDGYEGADVLIGNVALTWDYDACRWKIVAVYNPSGGFGRTRIVWGGTNPADPTDGAFDQFAIVGIAAVESGGDCEICYELFCPDETFSGVVSLAA